MSFTLHGREDPRKTRLSASEEREPSLVRLYMELTGGSESAARSVLMYVGGRERENNGLTNEYGGNRVQIEEAARRWLPRIDSDRGEGLAMDARLLAPA